MGTSISQASERNTNWRPVHLGYEKSSIPENRIINEIWRASENEPIPMSQELKSDAVYNCFIAVKSSDSFTEAWQKANAAIFSDKNNNLVAEFAKRVIPAAYQSQQPIGTWAGKFFSEVTNYVVSRDASGFIGQKYRIKSIRELISFKKSIVERVREAIESQSMNINNKREWNTFIDSSISALKKL
ncbi:hypothetical protein [Longitalea arenae]|uniref:hypothetical protein n=1 Tax=Longitalea arenae TaxID=2812558 RepID=UPI0019683C38|nr:hypothetical protein [Longitalea arenae]